MARTQEQILLEIQTEADKYPDLSQLQNNASAAAVWDYAKRVMASGIAVIEQTLDQHKLDVQQLIDEQQNGIIDWYKEQILAYQHGDDVVVQNNRIIYETIDPAKQIIKQVDIDESAVDGSLTVKVAKGNPLEPLTATELAGLQAYLARIKIAGTLITVASDPAILVRYTVGVEIDRLILNDNVERLDGTTTTPVQDALEAFHKSLQFNGTLYLSKASNAVQTVDGILDVQLTAEYFNGSTWVAINRKFEPASGYVSLDSTTLNVLN